MNRDQIAQRIRDRVDWPIWDVRPGPDIDRPDGTISPGPTCLEIIAAIFEELFQAELHRWFHDEQKALEEAKLITTEMLARLRLVEAENEELSRRNKEA